MTATFAQHDLPQAPLTAAAATQDLARDQRLIDQHLVDQRLIDKAPLDGPSARLYAEVTGMLARFSSALDAPANDDEDPLPGAGSRMETEQALKLALIAMTEAQKRIQRQELRILELESLSQTDELTGLANRRGFDLHLRKALAQARRNGVGGILLMIDLDGFKAINDRHGHAAGDALLQTVGELLRTDVRETDTVARLGGDEFAVLLPDLDPATGEARARRLAARLNHRNVPWQGAILPLAASVGMLPYDGLAAIEDLMHQADRRMYAEKSKRKAAR